MTASHFNVERKTAMSEILLFHRIFFFFVHHSSFSSIPLMNALSAAAAQCGLAYGITRRCHHYHIHSVALMNVLRCSSTTSHKRGKRKPDDEAAQLRQSPNLPVRTPTSKPTKRLGSAAAKVKSFAFRRDDMSNGAETAGADADDDEDVLSDVDVDLIVKDSIASAASRERESMEQTAEDAPQEDDSDVRPVWTSTKDDVIEEPAAVDEVSEEDAHPEPLSTADSEADGGEVIPGESDEEGGDATSALGHEADAASSEDARVGGDADAAQSKHLVVRAPALAKQYDGSNLQAVSDVYVDSGKVVLWRCECQHTWKQAVFLRFILKSPCPSCDAKKHPPLGQIAKHLVAEWDPVRNDPFVDVETIPVTSNHSAHWVCSSCRTPFEARVKHRASGKAPCPTCNGSALQQRSPAAEHQPLASTASPGSAALHELLSMEWHPVRNGDLRWNQVQPTTPVWWLCSCCGHEWEATTVQRLRVKRTANCPECKKKAH